MVQAIVRPTTEVAIPTVDFDDPFAAVTKAKRLLDQHLISQTAYDEALSRAAAILTAKMQSATIIPEGIDYEL